MLAKKQFRRTDRQLDHFCCSCQTALGFETQNEREIPARLQHAVSPADALDWLNATLFRTKCQKNQAYKEKNKRRFFRTRTMKVITYRIVVRKNIQTGKKNNHNDKLSCMCKVIVFVEFCLCLKFLGTRQKQLLVLLPKNLKVSWKTTVFFQKCYKNISSQKASHHINNDHVFNPFMWRMHTSPYKLTLYK